MGEFPKRGVLARGPRPTTCPTTAAIYSHALRGKDFAAAQIWDDIKEQARGEKSGAVN